MSNAKQETFSLNLQWWADLERHELSNLLASLPIEISEQCVGSADSVHFLRVSVTDFSQFIADIIKLLMNQTWMYDLLRPDVDEKYMQLVSSKTRDKLLPYFKEYQNNPKKETKAHSEFKEYAISYSAQGALRQQYKHKGLPLAELIKEQVSQNPGFDFHMLRSDCILVFGEAKYRKRHNGFYDALKKVHELVCQNKHISDCGTLNKFYSEAVKKCYNDGYALALAFSLSGMEVESNKKEWWKKIKDLESLSGRDVYVIGVQNDGLF